MKALVSRRNCLLVLRRRACVRLGLLFAFGPFIPELANVSIGFPGITPIEPAEASGVVPYPVPRPGSEDEASAIAAHSQPVSGSYAEFPQQVDRQGNLVFAADGAHDFLRGSPKVHSRGFAHPERLSALGFIFHTLLPQKDFSSHRLLC